MNSNSLFSEITQNPIPFCAGLVAGFLQLDLNQDPLKSWLEQQGYKPESSQPVKSSTSQGTQSIPID